MAKDLNKTIEELKQTIIELGGTLTYDRQHGRAGVAKENEQEELIRLRNNLASQVSRLRKKNIVKDKDNRIKAVKDMVEDDDGITPVDERRFKNCFIYENIQPELEYVQNMTGLTIDQIHILEAKYQMYVARTL